MAIAASPTRATRRHWGTIGALAIVAWVFVTLECVWFGVGPWPSAFASLIPAIGGLACWAVYHLLSRRRDNMLLPVLLPAMLTHYTFAMPQRYLVAEFLFAVMVSMLVTACGAAIMRHLPSTSGPSDPPTVD